MRAVDIITKKRSGAELSREELDSIISGYVAGSIPDYQVSALLMAIFFRGMTPRETADLTDLMLRSGDTMDLSGIPGPFVDKHSTGGVGDKVSIPLAPMVAACGARVPMMSGRALGHTGGTLDKLESIPGYVATLDQERFREGLLAEGYAMTGQTARVVPADKKLYALRDVTGTVESVPLITASILSKKVAEGADSLVFDVKCGPGAFMKTPEQARALAHSLVDTGTAMGRRIIAVITDMSEPLGSTVGNFFEIEESLDCLEGHGSADLMEVTYRLGGWMLVVSGLAASITEGEAACRQAVHSGKAMDLFLANVRRQGGDDLVAAALPVQQGHQRLKERAVQGLGTILGEQQHAFAGNDFDAEVGLENRGAEHGAGLRRLTLPRCGRGDIGRNHQMNHLVGVFEHLHLLPRRQRQPLHLQCGHGVGQQLLFEPLIGPAFGDELAEGFGLFFLVHVASSWSVDECLNRPWPG